MHNIHVRPASDLRDKYEEIVALIQQHDEVIITDNGVDVFAVVNIDDFSEFIEDEHKRL